MYGGKAWQESRTLNLGSCTGIFRVRLNCLTLSISGEVLAGTEIAEGGGGGGEKLYLTLHTHHQNESALRLAAV